MKDFFKEIHYVLLPSLAQRVGVCEAIFLQHLYRFQMAIQAQLIPYDRELLQEELFPFWTHKMIQWMVKTLQNKNLILTLIKSKRTFIGINLEMFPESDSIYLTKDILEDQIVIHTKLTEKIGLMQSLVTQYLLVLTESFNKKGILKRENTDLYKDLCNQFKFLSQKEIYRILKRLNKIGLLDIANIDDKTYYRFNQSVFDKMFPNTNIFEFSSYQKQSVPGKRKFSGDKIIQVPYPLEEKPLSNLQTYIAFNKAVFFWNTQLGLQDLKWVFYTTSRAKKFKMIFQKVFKNNMNEWKKFCEKITYSSFLMRQCPEKERWVTFDWILQGDNSEKVKDGRYHIRSDLLKYPRAALDQKEKNRTDLVEYIKKLPETPWKWICDTAVSYQESSKDGSILYGLIEDISVKEIDRRGFVFCEMPIKNTAFRQELERILSLSAQSLGYTKVFIDLYRNPYDRSSFWLSKIDKSLSVLSSNLEPRV